MDIYLTYQICQKSILSSSTDLDNQVRFLLDQMVLDHDLFRTHHSLNIPPPQAKENLFYLVKQNTCLKNLSAFQQNNEMWKNKISDQTLC